MSKPIIEKIGNKIIVRKSQEPDPQQLMGQMLVSQSLKIEDLEDKLDLMGQMLVELSLKE
ncbi:hypothetical protein Amet_2435 [Alkaliphilus metalliredigens QYMF]|uniref:Uncharacterized protein n=1 Tax=Alkaliphilus metalliredigens (strain QYMF) TaxID=293826 RepID=A6TQX1_ALKMQ|nr:hypothetical protein [Alkaliphilus metalliredigens]ABR48589.1 hypothetical protein Amet_2435 [Alkaliphilus metalliredigens QYMF]